MTLQLINELHIIVNWTNVNKLACLGPPPQVSRFLNFTGWQACTPTWLPSTPGQLPPAHFPCQGPPVAERPRHRTQQQLPTGAPKPSCSWGTPSPGEKGVLAHVRSYGHVNKTSWWRTQMTTYSQ